MKKEINLGGTFHSFRLSNGLTVWALQDESQPTCFGSVLVKAGAKDSPNSGIAHYFEHIMFKGSESIGTTDYQKEKPILDAIAEQYSLLRATSSPEERSKIQKKINHLSQVAAQYAIPNDFDNLITKYGGTNLNASTSYDYTVYHNAFTPEYLAHWCHLYSERLCRPVFRLFQSELETVYEEKNMYLDQIYANVQQELFSRVCAPHPYQYPILGSTEELKNPDLNQMSEFFKKYYRAGNMALILSGNFKQEGLESLLEETFGQIPSGITERTEVELPQPLKGEERFTVTVPIPEVEASGIIWHIVPYGHPDLLALQCFQELLTNEGKTGVLDRLILENKLQMTSSFQVVLNDIGVMGVFIMPNAPEQSNEQAQQIVLETIERTFKDGIDTALFQQAKLSLQKQILLQFEDPKKRQRLLEQLFSADQTFDDLQKDILRLKELTPEELLSIVEKYIGENRLIITKAEGRIKHEKLTKPDFDPILPPNRNAISPFAKKLASLPLQQPDIHIQNIEVEGRGCLLQNNPLATLYHTPNTLNEIFSLDLIFFRSCYNHPNQDLLIPYLELVGGGGKNAQEFNEALQSIGATLSFSGSRNDFRISLMGYDLYLEETLSLVTSFLASPEEDSEMFEKILQDKKNSNQALRNSPSEVAKLLNAYAQYGAKAEYMQVLTLDEASALKSKDLLDDLKEILCHEVDLHYVGTRSQKEVKAVLEKHFPIEKIVHPWEGYRYLDAIPVVSSEVFFSEAPHTQQTIIRANITLGELNDQDDDIATLFALYFGRGMSSVLFQEVREYRSLAYGVNALLNSPHKSSVNRASDLIIYMSTQTDKTMEALFLLKDLLRNMPISKVRFQNTVESLRSIASSLSPTMRMKTRRAVALKRQGMKEDNALELLNICNNVTLDNLVSFYEKYIKNAPIRYVLYGAKEGINWDELKTFGILHRPDLESILHL